MLSTYVKVSVAFYAAIFYLKGMQPSVFCIFRENRFASVTIATIVTDVIGFQESRRHVLCIEPFTLALFNVQL